MTRKAPALTLILLAACARSEDASLSRPTATRRATVETVPPRARRGGGRRSAHGARRSQDDQRALEFGPAGAPPLFSLRCDARRGMLLQRHGPRPPATCR